MQRETKILVFIVGVGLLGLLSGCAFARRRDTTQPLFKTIEDLEGETVTATVWVEELQAALEQKDVATPTRRVPAATPVMAVRLVHTTTQQPTAVPSATIAPSATPTLVATPIATLTRTPTATDMPLRSATPHPSPTWTALPNPTQTSPPPSPTASPLPTATLTPTPVPLPVPGEISGRVLLQENPLAQPVTLVLEDQAYQVIGEVTVTSGTYLFDDLPATTDGYTVVFSRERNPEFGYDEVVSWSWIGPTPVRDGDRIQLPDMEIGLLGLTQINPPPDSFFSSEAPTPENPLEFIWTPYPDASRYWLDLMAGNARGVIWQSDYVTSTGVTFNGYLENGELIGKGSYFWRVSTQIGGGVPRIVSGPLAAFSLDP